MRNRLAAAIALVLLTAVSARAQVRTAIGSGDTVPSSCTCAGAICELFIKTGTDAGVYWCDGGTFDGPLGTGSGTGPFDVTALVVGLVIVAAAAQGQTALSPCQESAAKLLQAEDQLDGLRRAMVSLQVQNENLRAPRWHALEQELGAGCQVDRETLKVTACTPLEGR